MPHKSETSALLVYNKALPLLGQRDNRIGIFRKCIAGILLLQVHCTHDWSDFCLIRIGIGFCEFAVANHPGLCLCLEVKVTDVDDCRFRTVAQVDHAELQLLAVVALVTLSACSTTDRNRSTSTHGVSSTTAK